MNIPVIPRYKIVVVPASCFRYISVFTVVHHERNQSKHVGEPHESKSNQPYLFETHKTNRVDPILEYSKTDEMSGYLQKFEGAPKGNSNSCVSRHEAISLENHIQ
jgi:hypothetical protein